MRGGHLVAGTGHRHGIHRPRAAGGGPAVGGQRPAAHRAREPQVGGRSTGSIFPRTPHRDHRRGRGGREHVRGRIEQTALVENALDVLAQQTVAAVAMDELAADDWFDTVRRAAPYSELPRRAFDSVLGMLAGRFATSRPGRILAAHRVGSRARAVAGASRLAAPGRHVGGHHPRPRDVLGGVAGRRRRARPAARGRAGRRDGVRVASRRHHHVGHQLVAYQRDHARPRDRGVRARASARLPFWHGEGVGRPAETGRMRGAFLRAVAAGIEGDDAEAEEGGFGVSCAVSERMAADGLDDDAQRNLVELIRSQRAATGIIPDDKTLVVERCEDEQGDWRVLLHSPYGRRVHEPWAMAVSDRIMAIYGYDAQAMAADDGIVLRIPMTETRLPRRRAVRVRLRRARPHRARSRGLHVAVLGAVPRMRRARPADVAHRAGQEARPAVAAAPQGRPAAGSCAARARVPHPGGNGARVLAGRVRHEGAARADGAGAGGIGALGGGADVGAVAVRGAASVRVRGRAPLRGRPAARRATRVAAVARPHAAGRAAGLDRLGRRAGRGRDSRRGAGFTAPLLPIGACAASRARPTCCACWGLCPSRRRRCACVRTPKRTTTGQRTQGAAKWPPKRKRMRCSKSCSAPCGASVALGPGRHRRCGVSARCAGRATPVGRCAQPPASRPRKPW